MLPKISICVPVYGVEQYIADCARSLFEQTYENLEYVFVDDCTEDDSISILNQVVKNYPKRQAQVKILTHTSNQGLAVARRTSIENATGEYLTCVDSDDTIALDMIEMMYRIATASEADIVVSGCDILFDQSTDKLFYLHSFFQDKLPFSAWGKLFHKSLFADSHVFTPKGLDYGEDRLMSLKMLLRSKKVACIPNQFYNYRQREMSITSRKNEWHFQCLERFWKEADKALKPYFDDILKFENDKKRLQDEIALRKIKDKTKLMLSVKSNKIRKQFADLYRDEETGHMKMLTRGYWLMSHLVHYHLWGLISIYQLYINNLDK